MQKLTQIFATAQEVGLVDAVTPVCQRAMQTVIQPITHGIEFPTLRMEGADQPQALIDLVSYTSGEDEMDLDLQEPEIFVPMEEELDGSEWGGFTDVDEDEVAGTVIEGEESSPGDEQEEGQEDDAEA